MNFKDILTEWEKDAGNKALYKDYNKDRTESGKKTNAGERRSRLLRKKPDAYIDLHGLKYDEASNALEKFFDDSRQKGLEKILIIHGKGNHGGSEGALKELAKKFIESCSYAGESGYSSSRDGGSGSTWVILKETNPPADYRSR